MKKLLNWLTSIFPMITSEPTSASSIVIIETVSNVVNADLSPCSPNLTASYVCECADIVDKGIVAMEPMHYTKVISTLQQTILQLYICHHQIQLYGIYKTRTKSLLLYEMALLFIKMLMVNS